MIFLNKKIIGGVAVSVVLLFLFFSHQKGWAAITSEDVASDSMGRSQNALNNAVSFFLTTGETIPNKPIKITATSYSFDLGGSEVTWRVNGKVFKTGTGERHIEVMLGDAGSSTKIEIDARTVSGQTYHKEITVIPAAVDVVWQAQTYTPAWYKGKPMPSSTSEVRIVAIPYFKSGGGNLIPGSDLVYKWNLNYKVIESASGYGKASFLIAMPKLMYEARVEVEVATKDRSIVRKGVVKLNSGETKTLLYEKHPTKGVEYSSALSKEVAMEEDTFNVKAEPFFFALKDLNSLVYNWSVNGKKMDGTEKFNNLVFTKEADDKGTSSVSVETKNVRDFLQTAKAGLLIDFNN